MSSGERAAGRPGPVGPSPASSVRPGRAERRGRSGAAVALLVLLLGCPACLGAMFREARLDLAEEALRSGDHEKAWMAAISADPRSESRDEPPPLDEDTAWRIARVVLIAGVHDERLPPRGSPPEILEALADDFPGRVTPDLYRELAWHLCEDGRPDEAEDLLHTALARFEDARTTPIAVALASGEVSAPGHPGLCELAPRSPASER